MSDLVKRTYRITKKHDKHVKKQRVGESEHIRNLIEKDMETPLPNSPRK